MSDTPREKSNKILAGVTGRAGSGKTTFARMLARKGALHLEADSIAWTLYSHPTIKKNLRETFGKKIFDHTGEINRKTLGKIVFCDPDELTRLNAIMHPTLEGELRYRINHATERVVILDAALLLDWSIAKECNFIIGLETSEVVSIIRLKRKKMPRNKAKLILTTQRPIEEFRELCDIMVENNGDLEDLELEAGKIWKSLVLPLLNHEGQQ
jgi:dephospho-CoA kinase